MFGFLYGSHNFVKEGKTNIGIENKALKGHIMNNTQCFDL